MKHLLKLFLMTALLVNVTSIQEAYSMLRAGAGAGTGDAGSSAAVFETLTVEQAVDQL